MKTKFEAELDELIHQGIESQGLEVVIAELKYHLEQLPHITGTKKPNGLTEEMGRALDEIDRHTITRPR